MQNKSRKTHVIELYKQYETLPLSLLHNYQILLFVQKLLITDISYLMCSHLILFRIALFTTMILGLKATSSSAVLVLHLEKEH